MGTATQTLPQPRVRYENGKIIVDVEAWMLEWALLRISGAPSKWLAEVLAAEHAAYRTTKHTDQVLDGIWKQKTEVIPLPARADNQMTHLTGRKKSEIRRLRKTGMSTDALARRFKVGRSSVERVVREREKEISPEEKQLILHLHFSEEVEIKQLALRFGVPEIAIQEILATYDKRAHGDEAIKRSYTPGLLDLGNLSMPGPGTR
jgi:transposase